jgi:hypothetical protein
MLAEREAARERTLERRAMQRPHPLARTDAQMGGRTTGVAVPKEEASQSQAYMDAVRGLGYCVRCGRTCRPQFCHGDQGKGTGLKTDVRAGWAGCGPWGPQDPGCHYVVGTSGTLSKAERRAEEGRLAALTRAAVLKAGTWPKSLPVWQPEGPSC